MRVASEGEVTAVRAPDEVTLEKPERVTRAGPRSPASSGASPTSTPTRSGSRSAPGARAWWSPTSTPGCSSTTRRWWRRTAATTATGPSTTTTTGGTRPGCARPTAAHPATRRPRHAHDGHDGRRRRPGRPDRRGARRPLDRRQGLRAARLQRARADLGGAVGARAHRSRRGEPRPVAASAHRQQLVERPRRRRLVQGLRRRLGRLGDLPGVLQRQHRSRVRDHRLPRRVRRVVLRRQLPAQRADRGRLQPWPRAG